MLLTRRSCAAASALSRDLRSTGKAGLRHQQRSNVLPFTSSPLPPSLPIHSRRIVGVCKSEENTNGTLVGEDAAAFDPQKQSKNSWVAFFAILGTVLGALYLLWMQPGFGFADDYLDTLKALSSDNPEATEVASLVVFALFHSGLAAFRPTGEQLIGERAYRVIFSAGSLMLAVVPIVFFINHRYDGIPLWNLRDVPGVHSAVWALNFVSFYFLYPSTFNILEVAAVDKPKLHLWETGIMRITRHPQLTGMSLWAVAHTAWIGSSFTLITMATLVVYHWFGTWHGDRRLKSKYGEAFEVVKARTSVVPFKAILEGRQALPSDYYKEFLRVPYLTITALTLGAYWAHPLMQLGSYSLHW